LLDCVEFETVPVSLFPVFDPFVSVRVSLFTVVSFVTVRVSLLPVVATAAAWLSFCPSAFPEIPRTISFLSYIHTYFHRNVF
jgi:hypothetical protein